jgi:DNA-binding SARP family transcriptional activator/tetratricopeptide (TPR) repeat protein
VVTTLEQPQSVRLRLFGSPRCAVRDEPHKIASPRPRVIALLALVAAHAPEPYDRDALAFALWPDDPETDARGKLRRCVYATREVFPRDADPLLADHRSIGLNHAQMWCDVAAFETARKAGALTTAVALYTGPLVAESADEPIVVERERLQAAFMDASAALLKLAQVAGDDDRAFELASQMHAVDPWREDIVRALMQLRATSGDRAGALSLFDRFAQRLRADMNVDPMAETVELRDRLQQSAPIAAPHASAAPRELPFTGRAKEMAELRAAARRVTQGTGGLACVCGEAGIGKSRLVQELATELGDSGWRVITGTTAPGGERRPFQPLVEAIAAGDDRLTALDSGRRRLLDELAGKVEPGRRAAAQQLYFDALAAALVTIAGDRPLLVICEDVHACEEATLRALLFAARRAEESRILFVASYRSDEVPPEHPLSRLVREASAAHDVPVIALDRFAKGDVESAVAPSLAARHDASSLSDEFFRLSEGLPLVLAQVLENWAESGSGAAPAAGGTLAEIVAARIDRLSDDARTFLEVAAVAGDTFDSEVVSAAAGFDAAAGFRSIDEALGRRLIRENGRRAAYRLSFSHNLIRTHVYDALPQPVRDRLHRRLGAILEALGGDAAGEGAMHLDAASEYERAAKLFLLAARRFAERGAYERAATHAERGIVLARDVPVRFDLLLERERVASVQGDRARQGRLLDEAVVLDAEIDDERRARLLAARARLARARGNVPERRAAMAALAALGERTNDLRVRAREKFERGSIAYDAGETATALRDLASSLALCEAGGDVPGMVRALTVMIEAEMTTGTPERAVALVERLREACAAPADQRLRYAAEESAFAVALRVRDFDAAEAIGLALLAALEAGDDRDKLAAAHRRLGIVMANTQRWEQARSHFARARRIYRELEDPHGFAINALNAAAASLRGGRLRDAGRLLAEAEERFAVLEDHTGRTMLKANRAYLALHIGAFADADRLASEARDLAHASASTWLEAVALGTRGVARRERGDVDGALADLEAGISLARGVMPDQQFAGELAEYAVTLVLAERNDEAASVAAELARLRAAGTPDSMPWVPPLAEAFVAEARGSADADQLFGIAQDELERYLSSLDPVGRDEMMDSTFVRRLLDRNSDEPEL